MKNSKKALIFFASVFILTITISLYIINSKEQNRNSTYEKITTFFTTTKNNTSTYNVSAAGWDVRVIEWQPQDNPGYRCVFVAGTNKASGGCYPIKREVKLIK